MPEESKPKAVIDTNVYVSGLNFKGRPREILDWAWQREIEVYVSSFILEELSVSLKWDFAWSSQAIKQTIERIKAVAVLVYPKNRLSIIKQKDDDNRILECAVEGAVQYVISGDKKHLLSQKEYQGIRILSPAEFLRSVF